MPTKKVFQPIDPEQERDFSREARLQYDPDTVAESARRWSGYTDTQKALIFDEGNRIYADLADALAAKLPVDDTRVQEILERWHAHLHYFYEPTLEILQGLGELYNTDARFMATFQALHPDLPAYLQESIRTYTDTLETALLKDMLAEDEARRRRLQGD